jgi:transposase-like protein
MPACPHCSTTKAYKDGHDRAGTQRYRCSTCRRSFTDRTGTPFTHHRWPREVILMAVRWYFCYRLSAANVRNLLAERGLDVSRQTVAGWVQKFGVLLAEAARRHAKPLGRRWFVDETYLRVGGQWAYLYRAVDERGQVVDVLLREKRDLESAEAFFEQAIKRRGVSPVEVITDKHRAYLRAVRQHAPEAKHRRTGLHRKRALTTKPVERSHIPVKDRLRPMRGLGSVETGQRLLEGVELAQAVRRGNVRAPHQCPPRSVHERSRLEVATFSWLASGLRAAA